MRSVARGRRRRTDESGRWRLVVVTALVVVLAVGAVWTIDLLRSEGTEAPGEQPGAATDARLTMAPSTVQPGNAPADARDAETVFDARFTPARRGGLVLLELRTPQGWRPVTSAQQDARGQARLTAPMSSRASVFRATALELDGSRGATTNEVGSKGWTLAFSDDFEGTSLDPDTWMYRQLDFYNEEGSRACSKSDERAVEVADGTLRLRVMEDPDRTWESCYTEHGTLNYYLNGHVATEGSFDFRYGVAAARVKFPQGRGQHGAFWLQRNVAEQVPGDPGRSGAEIDVVEFFGEGYPKGGLASFLYYLNAEGENEKVGGVWPGATRDLPPGDAWWRSFHVFSVDWTPDRYVFRVDGREIFRTSKGVSGVDQFLILSLLSSDWELPKLDESTLPTTMEVDWVRVWQRDPAGR